MRSPLVSVIMPAFNASMYVHEAIRSVQQQTYKNWELVIVDDGSTDDTAEVIKPYLSDERVIYFYQSNQGVAAARNFAILKSRGNYIAFLDSDDVWLDVKLEKQVDYMRSEAGLDVGLIYSRYLCFYKDIENTWNPTAWFSGGSTDRFLSLLMLNDIGTLTVMVRREVLNHRPIFNSKFVGTEDWDLWLRISKKNEVHLLDATLAYYRVHDLGISKNGFKHLQNELKVIEHHSLLEDQSIPRHFQDRAKIFVISKFLYRAKLSNWKSLTYGRVLLLLVFRNMRNFSHFLLIARSQLRR